MFHSCVSDPPPLILVEDTVADDGEALFVHLLSSWSANTSRPLLVLCTEQPPAHYRALAGPTRAQYLDFYSDAHGWAIVSEVASREDDGGESAIHPLPEGVDDFLALLRRYLGASDGVATLMIDSLSYILAKYGCFHTVRLLSEFTRLVTLRHKSCGTDASVEKERETFLTDRGSVTAVLHKDVFPAVTTDHLEYSADFVMHFATPSTTPGRLLLCSKLGSGKVATESQHYNIGPAGAFVPLKSVSVKAKRTLAAQSKNETAQPNRSRFVGTTPASLITVQPLQELIEGLTFSLGRTEEEEASRQKVALPYMSHAKRPNHNAVVISFEEHEEEDEFFDDPDGDLDL